MTAFIEANTGLLVLSQTLPEFRVFYTELMSPLTKLQLHHILLNMGEKLFKSGQIFV